MRSADARGGHWHHDAKPDQIISTLDRIGPDLIINSAAYTAVDRAEDDSDAAYSVNAESPRAIARWAATRAVPLIHFPPITFSWFGQQIIAIMAPPQAKALTISRPLTK
jgi:hypothetical protein